MVMLVYQQAAVLWPLEVPLTARETVVTRRSLSALDRPVILRRVSEVTMVRRQVVRQR